MKRILAIFTVLSMTACGIYGKYKPETEVRDDLYGEIPQAYADTSNFGTVDWRNVFKDTSLQKLIDTALARNTDMRSALLSIKEAEAALMSARLAYIPSFNFAPQGTISGGESSSSTTNTYTLPLTASWQVDAFGSLTNAKRVSRATYDQSLEYVQAVRSQIISSVANLYYTLLMLDEQLKISEETMQVWKESVDATRAMMDAGMVNEAALAQTEASYYSICTTVMDLKEQINTTRNSLSSLIADAPGEIERGSLYDQDFPEEFSLGVPVQMLSNRPDVRSAEFALAQAFYSTNQARSAFYPSIVLSGNGGWTNSIGNMIVNPAQAIFSVIGSLTEPIFNGWKNVAQLRMAKARYEQAKLDFQQTLLDAGIEVNNALMQYQTAKDKADYFDKQIASLETAVSSTELLMEHGNTTYLEVLTARQSLLNAQLSRVANHFSEIQGVITIYSALGGGREDIETVKELADAEAKADYKETKQHNKEKRKQHRQLKKEA